MSGVYPVEVKALFLVDPEDIREYPMQLRVVPNVGDRLFIDFATLKDVGLNDSEWQVVSRAHWIVPVDYADDRFDKYMMNGTSFEIALRSRLSLEREMYQRERDKPRHRPDTRNNATRKRRQ